MKTCMYIKNLLGTGMAKVQKVTQCMHMCYIFMHSNSLLFCDINFTESDALCENFTES